MDDVAEKIAEQKRAIDIMQAENSSEFLEIKNQIVGACSDVLLQVQDNLMPEYEKQFVNSVKNQLQAPHEKTTHLSLEAMRRQIFEL